MIETIEYQGEVYPKFQTNGNAARFCRAFALEVCKGYGYDIGYGEDEWILPGAIGIDIKDGVLSATNLPKVDVDFIHSSHCLEHLDDWVSVLEYWTSKIRLGGVLFLYLPHYSQKYWRPWNNRKHKNIFTPEIMRDYFTSLTGEFGGRIYSPVFISEVDLYNSFTVIAEKRHLL